MLLAEGSLGGLHGQGEQLAEAQGMEVEVFGPETGWNFDEATHRAAFMKRLEQEYPDEVFFAPTCGPWSIMQNLNARTEEQREDLTEHREWHHRVHLTFVRKAYLTQIKQGGHAHIEQPAYMHFPGRPRLSEIYPV